MSKFRLVRLACNWDQQSQTMHLDAHLGGASGEHELRIRISDASDQTFESRRTIYFVDERARLTITPVVQGDVGDEGELLLTIDGEPLPPIPLIVRDGAEPSPSPATRVLVIADGSVDKSIIQRVLLDLLCDYDVAIDSQSGVQALESPPGYDLVITTRPEFVDHVRGLPGHRSTYVILTSPDGASGDLANDVLEQPLRQDRLMAAVVRGLGTV